MTGRRDVLSRAPRRGAALGRIRGHLAAVGPALGAEAPKWMHALTGVPLPAYDEKDRRRCSSIPKRSITVEPSGKIKRLERKAFKILRPDGAEARHCWRSASAEVRRVTDLHAWCIPASGKDYAVKQRDALEAGLSGVTNGDSGDRYSRALAAGSGGGLPGNIIGYETRDGRDSRRAGRRYGGFKTPSPCAKRAITLQLPNGWSYKATLAESRGRESGVSTGPNQWRWTLEDLAAVRVEPRMPPCDRQSRAACT
jgi:hypothetical protein